MPRSRTAFVGLASVVLLALVQSCASVSAEYKKKAQEWKNKNTRTEFFQEFNRDRDPPVSGPRADRLWNYIEEQLSHGGIVFKDSGALVYQVPMTHFLPLPDFFVDLIESLVMIPCRKIWYIVMDLLHESAHEIHHEWLEHFESTGTLRIVQGCIAVFIAFQMLRWAVYRFTDGVFPSERKLAKQTKKYAADYLAKKND
jgi:hypothetical protein